MILGEDLPFSSEVTLFSQNVLKGQMYDRKDHSGTNAAS